MRKKFHSPNNPAEGLLTPEDWEKLTSEMGISAREQSVAELLFVGKSRKQIAQELHCAMGTVRVHIDRLFDKLNVSDRLEFAIRIIRIHLELSQRE